jgi:XTP/dITP diphosphohydrolase
MTMKVLVATRSGHKLREIRQILSGVPGLALVSPDEVGLAPHPDEDAIESFDTFEDNALAKARWFQARTGLPTLADDSGLSVDALDGAPGVWSRRFAPVPEGTGPDGNSLGWESGAAQDEANNDHLLARLSGVEGAARSGRYVCVVAYLAHEGAEPVLVRGEAEGQLLTARRGEGGFGYDPLFLDVASGKTFAELTAAEKDARSHRGRAFAALVPVLSALRAPALAPLEPAPTTPAPTASAPTASATNEGGAS